MKHHKCDTMREGEVNMRKLFPLFIYVKKLVYSSSPVILNGVE